MANFTYNDLIPATNNNPSDDQPEMLKNTVSIENIIDVDHVGFNTNNGGNHRQVRFNLNQVAPGLNNGVGEVYANTISGNSFPFWNNGTNYNILTSLANNVSQNGYTYIGSILIQWGIYNAAGGNFSSGSTSSSSGANTVVTFPTPFLNNVFFFGGNLTFTASNLPSGTGTLNTRKSELNAGTKSSITWQVYTNTNNYLGFVWYAIGN